MKGNKRIYYLKIRGKILIEYQLMFCLFYLSFNTFSLHAYTYLLFFVLHSRRVNKYNHPPNKFLLNS